MSIMVFLENRHLRWAITAALVSTLGIFALAGCPGVDKDGDGFRPPADLDDNDPLTYPGAPELADIKDNNCNGFGDEPPVGFTRIGSTMQGAASAAEWHGDYVYLAASAVLQTYFAPPGTPPELVHEFELRDWVCEMAVDGDTLFLAVRGDGLHALDLTNPAAPQPAGKATGLFDAVGHTNLKAVFVGVDAKAGRVGVTLDHPATKKGGGVDAVVFDYDADADTFTPSHVLVAEEVRARTDLEAPRTLSFTEDGSAVYLGIGRFGVTLSVPPLEAVGELAYVPLDDPDAPILHVPNIGIPVDIQTVGDTAFVAIARSEAEAECSMLSRVSLTEYGLVEHVMLSEMNSSAGGSVDVHDDFLAFGIITIHRYEDKSLWTFTDLLAETPTELGSANAMDWIYQLACRSTAEPEKLGTDPSPSKTHSQGEKPGTDPSRSKTHSQGSVPASQDGVYGEVYVADKWEKQGLTQASESPSETGLSLLFPDGVYGEVYVADEWGGLEIWQSRDTGLTLAQRKPTGALSTKVFNDGPIVYSCKRGAGLWWFDEADPDYDRVALEWIDLADSGCACAGCSCPPDDGPYPPAVFVAGGAAQNGRVAILASDREDLIGSNDGYFMVLERHGDEHEIVYSEYFGGLNNYGDVDAIGDLWLLSAGQEGIRIYQNCPGAEDDVRLRASDKLSFGNLVIDATAYGDYVFVAMSKMLGLNGEIRVYRYKFGDVCACPCEAQVFLDYIGSIAADMLPNELCADESRSCLYAGCRSEWGKGGALLRFDLPAPGTAITAGQLGAIDAGREDLSPGPLSRWLDPSIEGFALSGNHLYIADARNGLYKLDLTTDEYVSFYPGSPSGIAHSTLIESPDGVIPLATASGVALPPSGNVLVQEFVSGRVTILAEQRATGKQAGEGS